ncbi:cysteine-rich CWC family protein [Marinomonas dokdonensis]|uniref:cysteine-rich CWC family protein n=1 Tax=Marinomonas dokdonensis TaxID=328224 RepID=UPI0040558035
MQCPFCSQDNQCSVAGQCWCFQQEIPASLLALLPPEQQDKRCVCQSCVQAYLTDEKQFIKNFAR